MPCNNANARRCSYFELGLPVVSLINSYLAIFLFSVSSEKVRIYNKSEQFDEKKKANKQTNRPNEKTNKDQPKTIIHSPELQFYRLHVYYLLT